MNTNDFYKQLMSEYTFDHEKIKKAAMGKVTEKKKTGFSMKWVPICAAAAALALTIGIGSAVMSAGNPISVTPSSSMTAQERFRLALEMYEAADDKSTEEVFLYVTFCESETPGNMQSILSRADSTGAVKVVEVHTDYGTVISGSSNIQALFVEEARNIAAVKIRCPANLFKVLSNDKDIYLVETADIFEDEDFSVIDTEYEYPDYPYSSETDPVTTPVQTEPEPVVGDSTPVKEEPPADPDAETQTEASGTQTQTSDNIQTEANGNSQTEASGDGLSDAETSD